MKARLSDHVRLPNGEIVTLASLVDAGRIEFRRLTLREGWRERRAHYAYFADLVETRDPTRGLGSGWEVHKATFEAQTKGV